MDKLDEALKVQFEKGESCTGENQKIALESQRRKKDKEEMERARLEEENRRNGSEQEEIKNVKEEVYSDEVDKKVKRLNFGKIDVSKWQGPCDEKNVEQSKYSFQEEAKKTKLQPRQNQPVHMEQPKEKLVETETLELVEKTPDKNELENGDEYEAKIKQKNIYRLDKSTLNFEREEMEFLRQEEIKNEMDPKEKVEDSDEDEFDKRVKMRSVGKLNMENSIFNIAEKPEEISVKPQTTRKIVLRDERPKEELIEAESAPDPVQQTAAESEPVEDEYEVKIKQRNINKLDKKAFSFEQTSDDVRRKQLGEDRIKCELDEMECLRQEEIRRLAIAENEPVERIEDSDEDEYERKVKKKSVGRLNMENTIFTVSEKEEISVKLNSQPKQKNWLQNEQSKEELVEIEIDPVQQTPAEIESDEDEFEVKIKQKNINKLKQRHLTFEQTSDDVRLKQIEEERIKRELDEMEFLRQEEIRRHAIAQNEPVEMTVEDSDEDEYERKVKKKSVGRLNLKSSIFNAADEQEKMFIQPEPKQKNTSEKEPRREAMIEMEKTLEPVQQKLVKTRPVERTPFEVQLEEEDYEVKVKQKTANKLDRNRFSFELSTDDTKRRQLEKETRSREKEEKQFPKQEELNRHEFVETKKKHSIEKNSCRGTEVDASPEKCNKEEKPRVGKLNVNWMNVISGETKNGTNKQPDPALQQKPEPLHEENIVVAKQIEEVECKPTMTLYNEDAAFEERRKNEGVKPLDFSKFVVSTNMDIEERKKRKLELERERQRIEREEIEQQRQEQLRRLQKATPKDELTFDKNGFQKSNANFVKESSNKSKQSEKTSGAYRKESMSGFSEEERETKEFKKQGKLELGIWADIDNSVMVKKQKSPNRNSVDGGKQVVPESPHTRYVVSCKLDII